MEAQSLQSFLVALIIFFFFLSASSTAQEVENEREFDYYPWSDRGPSRWGELREEWATCSTGTMQSPIDIEDRRVNVVRNSNDLTIRYKTSLASLLNRGYDISINFMGDAGSVKIGGVDYYLRQCHWHSPSEHAINGRRYDLELHMVHEAADPNANSPIAVLALLYKIGPVPDDFLSTIERHLRRMIIDQTTDEIPIGEINPFSISGDYTKYYKYMGSLTTPPCTEGVTWVVNKRIAPVSRQQVELLREAVDHYAEMNARPLQPLNNREIQLHYQASKLEH